MCRRDRRLPAAARRASRLPDSKRSALRMALPLLGALASGAWGCGGSGDAAGNGSPGPRDGASVGDADRPEAASSAGSTSGSTADTATAMASASASAAAGDGTGGSSAAGQDAADASADGVGSGAAADGAWATADASVETGVDAARATEAGTDASGTPSDDGSGGPCPSGGAPCVILPLGDSITFGYGSTTGGGYRVPLFAQAVADKHAITFVGSQTSGPSTVSGESFPARNEGHSGYTIDDSSATRGISPLVAASLATYKPNIVLLMIGTNDMHYALDLANAPARLGNLLDQITTDAPNAVVVVAKIIPAKGTQDTPTQTYNAAIPGVVQPRIAKGKHLVLVDMYGALKSWSSAEYKDSEHPNDTGYALMAQTWYAAVQGVLH